MRKHFLTYLSVLFILSSPSHSASPTITTNYSVVGLNHVFSQKIEFSRLRANSLDLAFPLVDTAFLMFSNPDFNIPVNELARVKNISITANLGSTAGSWQIDNPSASSASASITQSIKGWFSSLKPIGFGGTSASPNLTDQYSNNMTVLGNGTPAGDFEAVSPFPLGGELDSSVFSSFTGAGEFIVKLNAESFLQIDAPGMDVNVMSPSLVGDITLTYTVIPEPSTVSLLALGLTGFVALVRARRSVA